MQTYSLTLHGSASGAWLNPSWTWAEYEAAFQRAKRLTAHLPVGAQGLFQTALEAASTAVKRAPGGKERGTDWTGELVGHMARADREPAEAFRDYCYLMADNRSRGTRFKVRIEYRSWSTGMYIPGVGSLIAQGGEQQDCYVEYFPWQNSFFFDSYRDAKRAAVELPYAVWQAAYCADKLAHSGAGVASVKPFMLRGRTWITTSAHTGGSDPAEGEVWSLRPIDKWKGSTYSYATQCAAVEDGLIERGDHRGLVVSVRDALHVIDGAMTVLDPRYMKSKVSTPARAVSSPAQCLDVDGNPLFPGARCKVISVHHPAFNNELEQAVVVAKLAGEQVWVSKDEAPRYRINRAGRRVVAHDPRCIQTLHFASSLRLQSAAEQTDLQHQQRNTD
jgi:hypothetical protein